ncbi:hypothetical protein B7463_g8714, partial [Scytalidium lignicola]
MNQKGFTVEELALYRLEFYKVVLDSAKALIKVMEQLGIQPENEANREYCDFLMDFFIVSDSEIPLETKVGQLISSIWHDPCILKIMVHKTAFFLMDSAPYFFNDVERIEHWNISSSNEVDPATLDIPNSDARSWIETSICSPFQSPIVGTPNGDNILCHPGNHCTISNWACLTNFINGAPVYLLSQLCRRRRQWRLHKLTENGSKALFADRSPIPETSGNVYKITTASELEALLSSTTNVVVDFYADWCPPCRVIAPIFSKLADSHAVGGHLAFAKVNVDHVNNIAKRYDVSAMPTFVFFENGQPRPVAVKGVSHSPSTSLTQDGLVDRIRGADPRALTAAVLTLAEKAKTDTHI